MYQSLRCCSRLRFNQFITSADVHDAVLLLTSDDGSSCNEMTWWPIAEAVVLLVLLEDVTRRVGASPAWRFSPRSHSSTADSKTPLIILLKSQNKRKKGKGRYSSSWELHLRATGRHLPYGIRQCCLPPDTSERVPPNPSHAGWYSIYLPRRDGRLSWPSWLDSAPADMWYGKLSCHVKIVCRVANKSVRSHCLEFGKRHDTTDTTDFCLRQVGYGLATGKLV